MCIGVRHSYQQLRANERAQVDHCPLREGAGLGGAGAAKGFQLEELGLLPGAGPASIQFTSSPPQRSWVQARSVDTSTSSRLRGPSRSTHRPASYAGRMPWEVVLRVPASPSARRLASGETHRAQEGRQGAQRDPLTSFSRG